MSLSSDPKRQYDDLRLIGAEKLEERARVSRLRAQDMVAGSPAQGAVLAQADAAEKMAQQMRHLGWDTEL